MFNNRRSAAGCDPILHETADSNVEERRILEDYAGDIAGDIN